MDLFKVIKTFLLLGGVCVTIILALIWPGFFLGFIVVGLLTIVAYKSNRRNCPICSNGGTSACYPTHFD
jgi:ABC-type enterochelin transport system permease subunit